MKVALYFLLVAMGCAGCVSVPVEPEQRERHAPLIVTRSGETSQISWDSKRDLLYTVMYTDGPRARGEWEPLPGVYRVPGTGARMIYEEQLPANLTRHYRLMVHQPPKE
jgi:hypothetical protein